MSISGRALIWTGMLWALAAAPPAIADEAAAAKIVETYYAFQGTTPSVADTVASLAAVEQLLTEGFGADQLTRAVTTIFGDEPAAKTALLHDVLPGYVRAQATSAAAAAAPAGCGSDVDCKGDRICVEGSCQDPPQREPVLAFGPAPTPPAERSAPNPFAMNPHEATANWHEAVGLAVVGWSLGFVGLAGSGVAIGGDSSGWDGGAVAVPVFASMLMFGTGTGLAAGAGGVARREGARLGLSIGSKGPRIGSWVMFGIGETFGLAAAVLGILEVDQPFGGIAGGVALSLLIPALVILEIDAHVHIGTLRAGLEGAGLSVSRAERPPGGLALVPWFERGSRDGTPGRGGVALIGTF